MFRQDPLLKVGVIVMTLALALAIVAGVLTVLLRDVPEPAVASERASTAKASSGPLTRGESSVEPWREKTRPLPAGEVSKDATNPSRSKGEHAPGAAPAPEADAMSRSEPLPQPEPQGRAEPEGQAEPTPGQQNPTVGEGEWTRPTQREIEATHRPRHYDLPPGAIMALSIKKLGIYGAPVFDSAGPMALAKGVAHLPDTSLPWSPTPQRNVYLAGHRMGYRGTWSRMLFYNLDKLRNGDEVVLKDRQGRTYAYRVSETFLAEPNDRWVTGQVRGKDMLTLQTCTPIPTFEKRLIVRADRL